MITDSLTHTFGRAVVRCSHCGGPVSYADGIPFCRCRSGSVLPGRQIEIRWLPVVAYIGVIAALTWILWR